MFCAVEELKWKRAQRSKTSVASQQTKETSAETLAGDIDKRTTKNATDKLIPTYPYESIEVTFGIGLLIRVLVTRK